MSDLLNSASLVMIPSGYKEDVVYSQIPLDGSGDMSFTRSSNGTRVNSAGLVEVCPWNEAQQSNTFGTSPWSNTLDTGATLTYTANYGTAPDGTTTAGRLQMALNGGAYAQKNQIISVITGQQYTYSVYMRSLSGTKTIIFCYDNTNNITATVTTEWQRFTATFTGNTQVYCRFVLESGTSTSVDLLVYGAQLNIGSTAKPYFPTTDRLNVPRLTYQNGGGGCPSLLLEKQSTNLLKYSEDYTQLNWNLNNATITANNTTSPDGTQNADLLKEDSSNIHHRLYDGGVVISTSSTYTSSVFVKKASGTRNLRISFGGGFGEQYVTFNVNNGTIVATDNATGIIQNFGDGWYRCIATATSGLVPNVNVIYWLTNGNSETYQGDGTSGVYIYGAQLEASSYPTSYIPTTSSSATRVADACFKTGISSLIGQTEGTIFVQCNLQDSTGLGQAIATLYENSTNVIILYKQSDNVLKCFVLTGGTLVANLGAVAVSGNIKIAVGYKGNDFALYINGVQRGTDTSGSVPTCSNLYLGADDVGAQKMSGIINQAILFPTRLTNAELASLTTI